jgi:hypothetical protein
MSSTREPGYAISLAGRAHSFAPSKSMAGSRKALLTGTLVRAAKIRTAKLDAMAEGRPYKPTKRRRRKAKFWPRGRIEPNPYPDPSPTTLHHSPPNAAPEHPPWDDGDWRDAASLEEIIRERANDLVDV